MTSNIAHAIVKVGICLFLIILSTGRVWMSVSTTEIALLTLAICFLLIASYGFLNTKKKMVTNLFVGMNYYLSIMFLLMTQPPEYPIGFLGTSMVVYLPVIFFLVFSNLVQVPVNKKMCIFLLLFGVTANVFFALKIADALDLILLAVLFLSTILFCAYSLSQKRSSFWKQHKRTLVLSLCGGLLPFLAIWIIPAATGLVKANSYTFCSVLFVLLIPISIMRIFVKNAMHRNDIMMLFSYKSFLVGGIENIVIMLFIGLLFIVTPISRTAIPPLLFTALLIKYVSQISLTARHEFFPQTIHQNHDPFQRELDLLNTNIEANIFYEDFLLLSRSLVSSVVSPEKTAFFLLIPVSASRKDEVRVFSKDEVTLSKKNIQHICDTKDKVFMMSIHHDTFASVQLYNEDSVLGFFVFSSSSFENQLSDSIVLEITMIGQTLSKILSAFLKSSYRKTSQEIVYDKNNEANKSRMISNAILRERKKYRNYLHDNILQDLLSVKMLAQVSTSEHPDLIVAIDQTIKEIRKLIFDAFPPTLYYLNMYQNLSLLMDEYNERSKNSLVTTGAPVFVLRCGEDFSVKREENIELIYRIIKELNDNAYIHSQAKLVVTEIAFSDSELIISVKDNGIGIPQSKLGTSSGRNATLGLVSLKYDIHSVGGTMTILPASDLVGTHVEILLPLEVIL